MRPGPIKWSCLLLIPAGIVADISRGATTLSQSNTVSVDFGASAVVKPALGFLLGFDTAPNGTVGPDPSSNLILPLAPRYWRGDPHLAYYQRIRSLAPAIPVDLVMSNAWGYPLNNWNNNGPPWQNPTAYQSSLQTLLASYAPLPANVIFEPWNEPNDGWAASTCGCGYQRYWNGTAQQFYQTYLSAFQTIRSSLGPNAQIAGPSFFDYDHQGIQEFLEFCLANGCEVNSLTWHELNDASSVANLPGDVQDARASFLQNPRYAPLKISHIDVNEIVGSTFTLQPAGTLAYYSALEASGADRAARSCWPDSTGVSACLNGTLDGLLTNNTFQPRAAWWLHKSYADGVGGRVQSVTGNPGIVVLASSTITGAATPQILIGNFNFQDTVSNTPLPVNVTLSLTNLQMLTNLQTLTAAGPAGSIDVRVELIPNAGEAAVSQLTQVAEMNASIEGGAAQVALPPLQVGEVFRVTLVPPAPQVATITSGGVVDPWNYTAGAAPGDWVTLFGTNLGPVVPQSWNPPPGGTLPTSLGGVSVSIAGTAAVLSYVSSSQINALIPASIPIGANQIGVSVNGMAGNPYALQVDPTHPVIYSVPSAAHPGNFYVTAALGGTAYLIGTPGVDPGVTRGAYPGDLVDLYMIGLGATQDPTLFITGRLFAEAAPIAATVEISLGGQTVSPSFAGLITPGLYLVRFNVPTNITPGDLPIFVSVNGNSTHSNVYFTISPN